MITLNLIIVGVAVFREPNEHHEVPKRQRGKHTNFLLLISCIVNISRDHICKNLGGFCLAAGNGCVQQDFAALPRNDGLKKAQVISY